MTDGDGDGGLSRGAGRPVDREALQEENRRIRRLRRLVDFTIAVILQGSYDRREAESMVEGVRKTALELFPGKESTFELVYRPRFERVLRERYGDARETVH